MGFFITTHQKEPKFSVPMTEMDMVEAYNNYQYDFSYADGIKFLLEYLKATNQPDFYKLVKNADYFSSTACWIARIISLGNKVPQSALNFLNEKLNDLKEKCIEKVNIEEDIRNEEIIVNLLRT